MAKKAIMMKATLWNMTVLLATGFDDFRFFVVSLLFLNFCF